MPSHTGFRRHELAPFVRSIVSGGQTGPDRAALDWALAHGIHHGGSCPKGRKTEDGVLPERYRLQEAVSEGYLERTKRNVLESDGTLLVNLGELDGGSLATVRFAKRYRKPLLVIQADAGIPEVVVEEALAWLRRERIKTLNVAGPRESKRPGGYRCAWELLDAMASAWRPRASRAGSAPQRA